MWSGRIGQRGEGGGVHDQSCATQITNKEKHVPKQQGLAFLPKTKCGVSQDHRVLGGTLKLITIDIIHKIHAPKIQVYKKYMFTYHV